jgi:hypothetical protein
MGATDETLDALLRGPPSIVATRRRQRLTLTNTAPRVRRVTTPVREFEFRFMWSEWVTIATDADYFAAIVAVMVRIGREGACGCPTPISRALGRF